MVLLGEGWRQPEVLPAVEEEPDPLAAVLAAVSGLREALLGLPAPQVHLAAPDLTDIVTAVTDLNGSGGPSAQDIAAAIRDVLVPALPAPPDRSAMDSALVEALQQLDFRMKGIGAGGVGGTVATISNDVAVKPAAGTSAFPVTVTSGVVTANVNSEFDMFGTQIVGSLNNLIEVHFDDPAYASYLTVTNSGAGAGGTQANGRVQWASGTTTSGSSQATTIDNAVYRPHFPTYGAFTAAFVTPPTGATDLAVLGLGDLTNGVFVGYKGSQFGVLLRQGAVDTFIPQGSFSETAQSLTLTNGNVFKVEVGLFGYAGYRVRWWSPTARAWVTLHQATPASAEPLFTNFDLPMTLQIKKNASDATNIKINTACWGAGSSSLQTRLTDTISDRSLAATVRSVIVGKTTAGGGGYVPVKVDPSGALPVSQGTAAAHSAGWETRDYFAGGQILADQTAAGAALTFTFSSAVQLVQVMTTGVEGRVDPFGGTPTSSSGIRVLADTPTLIPVQTSSVQVYAASGVVNVVGFRYV